MKQIFHESSDSIQMPVVAGALLLTVIGAVYIAQSLRGRQALLFLLGGAAGIILYHACIHVRRGHAVGWRLCLGDALCHRQRKRTNGRNARGFYCRVRIGNRPRIVVVASSVLEGGLVA